MEWDEKITEESKERFNDRAEKRGGEVIVCGRCKTFIRIEKNPESRYSECKNCEKKRADNGFLKITGYAIQSKESEAKRRMGKYYFDLQEETSLIEGKNMGEFNGSLL